MNRTITFFLAAILLSGIAGRAAEGGAPADRVAGRSVDQYVDELQSENRTVRLRAVKSLGAFGEAAAKPLRRALEHDDPAVRYTAAVHLGRLGGNSLEAARERLTELMADESSRATQMAAAFALCRAGQIDAALPLLIERVQSDERAMACSAAELIGMLGPAALPAQATLQSVSEANAPGGQGDYHIGGAAQNALRHIQGPDETTTSDD